MPGAGPSNEWRLFTQGFSGHYFEAREVNAQKNTLNREQERIIKYQKFTPSHFSTSVNIYSLNLTSVNKKLTQLQSTLPSGQLNFQTLF